MCESLFVVLIQHSTCYNISSCSLQDYTYSTWGKHWNQLTKCCDTTWRACTRW